MSLENSVDSNSLEDIKVAESFIDVEACSKLERNDRYEYSVSEIVFNEMVWAAQTSDGVWVMIGHPEKQGSLILPVWPNMQIAENICKALNPNIVPTCIDIKVFNTQWVKGLIGDNIDLAMFPTFLSSEEGRYLDVILVTPMRFASDCIEFTKKNENSKVNAC